MRRQRASRVIRPYAKRSPLVLLLLLLLWSICLGCGLGLAMDVTNNPSLSPRSKGETRGFEAAGKLSQATTITPGTPEGTVDPVPSRYRLGQEVYRESCGTCHIALPPAVLPDETWRNLLQDEQHYGERLPTLSGPSALVVWEYIQAFSRPPASGEPIPYRLSESRYFKALHPRVNLPRNIKIASCVTCHPSATQFNFRKLTPEWENSL